MPTSQKYQQRATECLRLAKLANDPSNRRLLLELGQAWSRLAEQPTARAEGLHGREGEDAGAAPQLQ